MKHLFFLSIALTLLASCSDGLSRKKAYKLLEKEYPKELFYQVFTADRDHAQNMQEKGLVAARLVTIDTKASYLDPIILFTAKANTQLLPTPDNEKARKIQRVKTGEYHLIRITAVKSSEKKVAVEYIVEIRNLTAFAKLYNKPLIDKEQKTKTAYFIKYNDGWHIDKTGGLEYLLQ